MADDDPYGLFGGRGAADDDPYGLYGRGTGGADAGPPRRPRAGRRARAREEEIDDAPEPSTGPQATDDLPPAQPPAARELAERSKKSPTPPLQPREEPPWYEEMAQGVTAFGQGAAFNVLDDAYDAVGASTGRDYIRQAAREQPMAHTAGRTVRAMGAAALAPASLLAQGAAQGITGLADAYGETGNLGLSALLAGADAAMGAAGHAAGEVIGAGYKAARPYLPRMLGGGDELARIAPRPASPLRGEPEPTSMPRPSAAPMVAPPAEPLGPPPLPRGAPTLPAPGGPPPPPPQRAPFEVAPGELLPPHPPAPAPRPANPPPPMRSDDALEMELLSPEPPAPLPVPGGQAGETWPPDYAPPPYSRANSGRFERPPPAASTLEYVPSEARPRMGRPDLSHPELANEAERQSLLDEFLSPSESALRTSAPIPEPRAAEPLSIAEPPVAPRRLLGELDQTPSARPPAMAEEPPYALSEGLDRPLSEMPIGPRAARSIYPPPESAGQPAGVAADLAWRGARGAARLFAPPAGRLMDVMRSGVGKNVPLPPVDPTAASAGRALFQGGYQPLRDKVLDSMSGRAEGQAPEDAPAYASSATLNYALSEAMSTDVGKLGLGQRDHEALTSALVRGDDSAIAALDYRLRQKYPAYAYQVERQLRDLNDEGD